MLKENLQEKANRWIEVIKGLAEEQIECYNNGTEFKKVRALAEYKGRIYALRQIAEEIGIEIDTLYN